MYCEGTSFVRRGFSVIYLKKKKIEEFYNFSFGLAVLAMVAMVAAVPTMAASSQFSYMACKRKNRSKVYIFIMRPIFDCALTL